MSQRYIYFVLIKIFTDIKCVITNSLIAQSIKNPTAIQETPVQFLGWEDSLKKGWDDHSSILGLPLWLRW